MAIDANMELVEEDGLIDVFGYMKKLRQARRGLVETLVRKSNIETIAAMADFSTLFKIQEQYKFIYDTLEENVTCGLSWFPVSELSTRLKQKSIRNPATKLNEYQREYAVRLTTVWVSRGQIFLLISNCSAFYSSAANLQTHATLHHRRLCWWPSIRQSLQKPGRPHHTT